MIRSTVLFAVVFFLGVVSPTAICHAQISVLGEMTDDRFVDPGSQYDGTITVRNETDVPQEVKIYQTDYTFRFDGTTVYGEAGRDARSNARWVSFAPSVLRLEPRATGLVTYSVSVPDSSAARSLAGSYWSLLMVEAIPAGSPESSLPRAVDRDAMGISQSVRYGIQIATHIKGSGKKQIRFLNAHMQTTDDGSRELIVDLENTGDLWFRPTFSAEVFDLSGNSKGVFKGSTFRMYPGTSVRQRINLGMLARGKYTVVLIVDGGGEDVFGAEYSLML